LPNNLAEALRYIINDTSTFSYKIQINIYHFLYSLPRGPGMFAGNLPRQKYSRDFFHNTDYELNIYRINGKIPGKTILIIGGIQGDEPGGFLSADLYADMELVRGNLIVVPRANYYSIILNRRQVNEDMNRKFSGSSRKITRHRSFPY